MFWSGNALDSDPVKTEADEAERQGNLLPVQLDTMLDIRKLPLGHDRMQFTNLATWSGGTSDPAWRAFVEQIEHLAMPPWVLRRLAEKDAELRTERRRAELAVAAREAAEKEVAKLLTSQQANNSEAERTRESYLLNAGYLIGILDNEWDDEEDKVKRLKLEDIRPEPLLIIQDILAKNFRYIGPVDGRITPEFTAALSRLCSFSGEWRPITP